MLLGDAIRIRLDSEAAVIRAMRTGCRTLTEIYAEVEQGTDVTRDGGLDPMPGHPGDPKWQHRVRCVLQNRRAAGHADRVGHAVWVIRGTPERPERLLLVISGDPREFELRLQDAAGFLATLGRPVDLLFADPPWALGRGRARGRFANGGGYQRDPGKVIGGYVDVDPAEYEDFTHGWVSAAAAVLGPHGQLAVVTGPQRAAHVQVAAEHAGLTWVSSIAARKEFPLASLRQPSCAHWTITVMTRGRKDHAARIFHPPGDLPAARTGHPYPLDWWEDNGRSDTGRHGLVRNDNELPLRMVRRVITMLTDPGGDVADPFLGGGSSAVACYLTGRRFTGADINYRAVRFAAARLLAEHAWPDEHAPALFT